MKTSLDLAVEFDKSHRHVLRDIEKVSKETGCSIEISSYKSMQNKTLKMIILNDYFYNVMCEKYRYKHKCYAAMEYSALCAVEQLLNIKLERQYKVDDYRVDGYHKESNTAYEVDEPQHFVNGELKQECKDRQAYIESKLMCKFVRIKV